MFTSVAIAAAICAGCLPNQRNHGAYVVALLVVALGAVYLGYGQ